MIRLLIVIAIALTLSSYSDSKFKKVKVNDTITVFVPSEFRQLNQDQINQRYQSARKPLVYFTDQNGNVDFSANMSYSLWAKDDIELLRSFYRSTLMSLYDHVEFITDEVRTINGRKYAVFEIMSKVEADPNAIIARNDVVRYTYIQYTIIEGNNTVLFNFSCPKRIMDQWKPVAESMMSQVEVDVK